MDRTVVVTGGAGFVGSNLARRLLDDDEGVHVIVFDRAVDDLAWGLFAPYADRVTIHIGDITSPESLASVARQDEITHVAHGAMVAHVPQWEIDDPTRFVHVNVVGTSNVLEWARRLPSLERLVYVSSGGVYGDATPDSPEAPQTESGPFNPPELYAISKYTSELITRRYGVLFGLDVRAVRLSWVFGPMERVTSSRTLMSPPYAIARAIIEDRPVTVTRRSLQAVGDFLSSTDIAPALRSLLFAAEPRHAAYNIAAGELTTIADLLDLAARAQPGARHEVVADGTSANIDHDPALRRARWNAYDIERMRSEFGWGPRPLAEQLETYYAWVLDDPAARCPAVTPSPA